MPVIMAARLAVPQLAHRAGCAGAPAAAKNAARRCASMPQLVQGCRVRAVLPRHAPRAERCSSTRTRAERAPAGASTADEKAAHDAALGRFDWRRAWYAVAVVDSLDADIPMALTVLGVPMAFWRDAEGVWRALHDECPHRLAPLSEGRVEADGTLQVRHARATLG